MRAVWEGYNIRGFSLSGVCCSMGNKINETNQSNQSNQF